ncbi:MAG TPA: biotin transporter BioY [Planctomycetes bacterium]|nr:biotin transporter BioY [Planctomycetota bacterium]
MSVTTASLAAVVVPRPAANVIMVTAFASATALGAFVRMPLPGTDVPFTLQVYFVLLAGLSLGALRGAASQLLYVAAGTAGVPVFIGIGGGISYLLGPTGGYLAGFIAAALLVGRLSRGRGFGGMFLSAFAGALVILTFGTVHRVLVLGMALPAAFASGFLPFVAVDAAKAFLAALAASHLRSRWNFSS